MSASDPQFIYMVVILPGMFGLTLMGEGIVKLVQNHVSGWFNLMTGLMFLLVIVGGYFFLSGSL